MSRVPLDLRQRIVEACERKEGTYFELARRFGVGEATVYRLVRLKRERGNVIAPIGIAEHELPQLIALVGEFPDATLEQLKNIWVSRNHRQLSRSSVVRALRRAGVIRNKASGCRGRSTIRPRDGARVTKVPAKKAPRIASATRPNPSPGANAQSTTQCA